MRRDEGGGDGLNRDRAAETPPRPAGRPAALLPTGVPICIDGRLLDDGGAGTGVAQYARTLIAALGTQGIAPLILDHGGAALRRGRAARLVRALAPWPRRAAARPGGFHRRDLFAEAQLFFDIHRRVMTVTLPGPPGIMHWTYPLPIRIRGWRNLYTVHDVLPLDPAVASPVDGPRLRRMLEALRGAGGAFATVSHAAQAEITGRMGWPADAVTACHQGVDVTPSSPADLPAGLRAGGYLLYVGAIEARKNLRRLLDAYRASGIATPLVLSGPDGLGAAEIDRHLAATPGAVRLPLQPRDAVLRLIAGARALLLVSPAEGFGLPVAEAMALGTPVMAAEAAALAEVAGGAALLVDPFDIAAIARGLGAIDGDAGLRADLSARGGCRAAHFALRPYARRLLTLYGAA